MESLRKSGDFRELLSRFNAEGVRYLIVGGFALAHYGRPRYTKDLDVWIDREGDDPDRVSLALTKFSAPLERFCSEDFRDADTVFQIGVEPIRIDILTDISGLVFSDAWPNRVEARYGDVPVCVISKENYIANKRASARASDLRDVESLLDDHSG
jgi:hypothetical protein